jgi:ABC-2 type transport system ATP-binding protein
VLKHGLQKEALFEIETSPLNGFSVATLEAQPGVRKATCQEGDGGATLNFILKEEAVLAVVINTLTSANVNIMKLSKHEPTLEDVFVEHVGRSMADMEQSKIE